MRYFAIATARDGHEDCLGVYDTYTKAYDRGTTEARSQQYRDNADKPYTLFRVRCQ